MGSQRVRHDWATFTFTLDMRRCRDWYHKICSPQIFNYIKMCPIRFPGAQSASFHPELPQGLLKVNSCSSTGFNLLRGRWQMPLLFSCWQCSWQVPINSWQRQRSKAASLSILLHIAGIPFLRMNNTPLYVYTTFSLSIHLLMNICVVSLS